MQEAPGVSIGVPTKDRHEDLIRCLRSVAAQTLVPIEVLVVDDGNLSAREQELCCQTIQPKSCFRYFKKDSPSLSRSKNLIAEKAVGDLVLILDDDTVMAEDYVERLAACFARDAGGRVGAVAGYIANSRRLSAIELLWKRTFLLTSPAPGDITATMFESRSFESVGPCEVKWLPGGITMYRRHVLRDFPFENFWGGRNAIEEVEHAIRVGRHYRYVLNPSALISHYNSPVARESMYMTGFKHAYNRCLIFRRYSPKGVRRLLFAWSFFGYLLGLVLSRKLSTAHGNIAGLSQFLYDSIVGTVKGDDRRFEN